MDTTKEKNKKLTQEYSFGLEYEIVNNDAWVIGIGTCTDENLIIPAVNENGHNVVGIRENAFEECNSITNVIVPKTVKIIEGWAFHNCIGIKSVKLHYGLKEIWQFAFGNCTSLTSIEIPSSVINIGNIPKEELSAEEKFLQNIFGCCYGNPFKGCKKLRSIRVNSGNRRYCDYINCLIDKEKKTIVSGCKSSILPDGDMAEIIGPYAFYDCGDAFKNGLYVFGNPKIKVIGSFAFAKCNIEKLHFPNTLTRIEGSAFRDCSNIKEVTFPDSLNDIGCSAFEGCAKLYKIKIPSQVKTIDYRAFKDCQNLTSIAYSTKSKITKIAAEIYFGCTSLMEVNLPPNLEEIGDEAFCECKNLQNITFPNTLKAIGKKSFSLCEHLRNVFIPKSVDDISEDAFLECWPYLDDIKCETNIKPENWHPNWNRKREYGSYHEVTWNAKK